jgi:hypothetical protein
MNLDSCPNSMEKESTSEVGAKMRQILLFLIIVGILLEEGTRLLTMVGDLHISKFRL